MRINLQKTYGKKTITREDGKRIGQRILSVWKKEDKIVVDFNNILIASVSFIDEAFGKLAFDIPKDELIEKMAFENLQSYDRALLNDILISRYRQKDLKQNGPSRKEECPE